MYSDGTHAMSGFEGARNAGLATYFPDYFLRVGRPVARTLADRLTEVAEVRDGENPFHLPPTAADIAEQAAESSHIAETPAA